MFLGATACHKHPLNLLTLFSVMTVVTGHMVFFSAWLDGVKFVKKTQENI